MHYHWDLSMVLADSSRWWSAAGVTMLYSFATVVGGIVIGVICGLGLLSRRRWLTLPLEGYVEVFRCTPLLVQIVWFYYALPILLNFSLPAWLAAGLGLTLHRDLSRWRHVHRARAMAGRPRAWHDPYPTDAPHRPATGVGVAEQLVPLRPVLQELAEGIILLASHAGVGRQVNGRTSAERNHRDRGYGSSRLARRTPP
jgi:His/Glu/Gln/Arg/opine family amino acid ABC transporter permease subunit